MLLGRGRECVGVDARALFGGKATDSDDMRWYVNNEMLEVCHIFVFSEIKLAVLKSGTHSHERRILKPK